MECLGPVPGDRALRRDRLRDRQGHDWLAAWSLGGRATLALDRPVAEAYGRDGETLVLDRPEIELGPSPRYLRFV
jgi:hypothetical protein